ncbi:unnamed protein product, partial [Heterosigma akashiwo]
RGGAARAAQPALRRQRLGEFLVPAAVLLPARAPALWGGPGMVPKKFRTEQAIKAFETCE